MPLTRLIKIIIITFIAISSCAKNNLPQEEKYSKHEYQIEMRDGIKLYTIAYIPANISEEYPIIMTRTPYSAGPYGNKKNRSLPKHLSKEEFIFVYQDVRGKYMSEGEYVNMRPYIPNKKKNDIDETTDTYDTIEWLINNVPNNNGKVGIYGISYPGFYAAMSLNEAHPALKAVSPQAPIADWFVGDDMHHNGAFTLSLSYVFFSSFGVSRPNPTPNRSGRIVDLTGDSYNYFLDIGPIKNVNENYFKDEIGFWNDFVEHGTYDEFWQSRNTLNYFENVIPAVMTVGGWYDNEDLYGSLNTYQTIEKKNKNVFNILVMGPWAHGGWARTYGNSFGDMNFGSSTSQFYREEMELPFFKYYLKGEENLNLPEAYVFETGKNKWRKYDEWPPPNVKETEVYLADNSILFIETKEDQSLIDYTEYISDPANPVPYTAINHSTRRMYNKTYMVEDQRFAAARPDVITFESDYLTEDLTIAGPIEVELYVSTSGTDSDWIVKLIDVFPDSTTIKESMNDDLNMAEYQMLVRAEIMRGKFRNSYEHPEPFEPNKATKVKLTLNDSHHTFLKGHKLMVQIQSSWFPMFDRNPQTFCDIYNADEEDFQKATQRVYHTGKYSSRLILKVIE